MCENSVILGSDAVYLAEWVTDFSKVCSVFIFGFKVFGFKGFGF